MHRSPNIVRVIKSRRLKWAGHVTRMEEVKSAFKILIGKPTGKRPVGRSSHRWEDNIRMDIEEIGVSMRNWLIQLSIESLESSCECGIEPLGFIRLGV